MTKEQYESLPLSELRQVAKARGIRGISTLRKPQLISRMLEQDEKEKTTSEPAPETAKKSSESASEAEKKISESTSDIGERDSEPSSETGKRDSESFSGTEKKHSELLPRIEKKHSGSSSESRKKYSEPSFETGEQSEEHTDHTESSGEIFREKNTEPRRNDRRYSRSDQPKSEIQALDSGDEVTGFLEVLGEGYGFIRSNGYLTGEQDVYVSPSQIRRFNMKTGDVVTGNTRTKSQNEKFSALLYVKNINGMAPSVCSRRISFEKMTPIFPNRRIYLERPGGSLAMRVVDLVSPIGKGQRGMIVSPPKAGKTTLLKDAAQSILRNNPEMYLIILLIDERPEEVTDIRETVRGENVEVISSTFDELPAHHIKVADMAIERAKRLVEAGQDVVIFIDSITRLTRANNQEVTASGRTLSGGLDPAALHMPKRFFGAARNMREGGSLTILATALVDTGSKMDDVVYEEFKGTGNMELVLNRKLQERRIFPAIDIAKSGTRREDLLLDPEEQEAVNSMRRALNGMKAEEAAENILNMFAHSKNNAELVQMLKKQKIV